MLVLGKLALIPLVLFRKIEYKMNLFDGVV
jgi:hypothetical protein